jgi:outer membrane usher protein
VRRSPAFRSKHALAFALSLVFSLAGFAAGPAERAVLPVTVNGVEKGDLVAYLREGDVLLRVGDLQAAGMLGLAGRRETVDGQVLVSLASLAPEVRFTLAPETLVLGITVPPEWLGTTVVNLGLGRPAGVTYSTETSAFLNYAVNWHDFKSVDAFGEAGLSLRGNLLTTSFTRAADGSFVRGLSSYIVDDLPRLRRWVVGDSVAAAGGLGGAVFMGGLSVSRDFDLDPYFVRYPTLSLAGAVTTPSTVDVYVNGALVRREPLPPGTFDLTNLSVPTGSGTTSVVIRDAFGQEHALTNPFYASTAVLGKGLEDYGYNLGFLRDQISTESADYGSLVFVGHHRVGLTDTLTLGARLEGGKGIVSGGPDVALRLPVGELGGAFGVSRDESDTGFAGSLIYRYIGQPVNYGASVQAFSSRYANVSLNASQDRPLLDVSAFVGAQLGRRVGLTLQYSASELRDGASSRRASAAANITLIRDANLLVSGARTRSGGQNANEVFVGLSYFLGASTTASASYQHLEGVGTGGLEVQKSLPFGTGFGYRVNGTTTGDQNNAGATAQYQGPFGLYEATYQRTNGQDTKTLSASGGIVAIGGEVFPTRPVGDAFALIRVPDVGGVTGLSSNQSVGRTSAAGNLLVPALSSYYGNRIAIADQDLPLDYAVETTEKTVAPPFRGGAVVTFPVRKVQGIRGTVVLDAGGGREVVPAYGELAVEAGATRLESPVSAEGEFYFENIPAGRHVATLIFRETICRFPMEIPVSNQPTIDVGRLSCAAPALP